MCVEKFTNGHHKTRNVELFSRKPSGFTLIELMVTLAVMAIILSVGTPYLGTFLSRTELTSRSNHLLGEINQLRIEAVKRNTQTVLCPSSDGTSCNTDDWKSGWIAFADNNGDGKLAQDDSEPVFSVADAFGDNFVVRASTGFNNTIRYKADSTLRSDSGTLTLCHTGMPVNNARTLAISAGGRINVTQKTKEHCS